MKKDNIGAFTRMCCTIGNIPTSYLVSMSYEEQLLWLCNYLENTLIPAVNDNAEALEELQNLFVELKDYVDHYFDNLDVQEEINNKLDEMALDGTLERIINEEIFSELNDTINEVKDTTDTIEPIVYDNEKNIKFPTYNLGMERIFRFIEDDSYLSMQGMCITPNNTIICTLWEGGASNNNKIVEINYNTGAIVKTATFSFGYANGITYDTVNDLVYIVPRGEGTGSPNLKTIKVLNYDDFSLVNTYVFDDFIQSVYFDKDTEECYLLSEWNLRNNGFNVYKVDNRFDVLDTISLDYSGELNKIRVQNFAVHDNYIYVISSDPKALIIYNIDGTVFKKYNLNEIIDELYYSGEYQDIDFLGNQCYVSSADNIENSESINQLFKLDLQKEYINTSDIISNVHSGYSITLYVDDNSTAVNPDGSATNKFKSINEALRYSGTCLINVANGTYNGIDIRSKSNFRLVGENIDNTIIKGVNTRFCNNAYLDEFTINNDMFNFNGHLNLYHSDLTLKDIKINGTKYGIYVGESSKCKLSSGITITTTNDNQIYVNSASVLYTPSTYYTIEKHNESTTIVGGVRLFETDRSMVVGEFDYDDNMNYIFNNDDSLNHFFKEIGIIYEIDGNSYMKRFPLLTPRNPMMIEEGEFSSTGVTTRSTVYVDMPTDTKKFRLRFSKVLTIANDGTASVVTNNSNDSYDEDSIVVKNCILY